MRRIFLITVVLSLLALPAGAQAQGGGSAVDEYTENVPGAGGDKPSDNVNGGGGSGGSLPPDVVSALEAQGADGAAAAALAQATSPKGGDGAKGGGTSGAADTEAAGDSGGGGVGEVLSQLAGGNDGSEEGMGVVLPIVLGAALLGAVALLIARRRGQAEPGEPA